MPTLRDFLYLNPGTLNNYLSTLEGYTEDEISHTQTDKEEKSGKAGANIIEGSLSVEKSKEATSKRTLTNPAKFQKLYDLLGDEITSLDLFDAETWDKIERGSILEVQATIHLPSILSQIEQARQIMPLIELAKGFGQEIAKTPEIAMVEGFTKLADSETLPLLFRSTSTPGFNFVANLSQEHLLCKVSVLLGEATVFGKVQRILKKGQKQEVFSVIPNLLSMTNLTKAQRQKLQTDQRKLAQGKLIEILHGPAIILVPLAVYR